MNILQLTSHFTPNVGGVETHLNDLVSALVKRNYNVTVLTYKPLVTKVTAKTYESSKNLKIIRIPWITGLFYGLVKNPVLEFIYLLPGLFLATPFVILFNDIDVIHTHGLIAGFVGVFWGKIFGKRVITTTHSIYHFPESGFYHDFSKWIFNSSDAVLTLSKQSKEEIIRLGVQPNKIKVFTYWVNLDIFKPIKDAKDKLGWNDKFIVFFVGRLIKKKGVLKLIEAYGKWDKDITLAIAGSGPLESEIGNHKTEIKNFKYLGRINNDKLSLYYSGSDLVVVPSIHEEGFGRVIIESLACGTPVIGSRRGAIPEAIDATVGVLIDVTPDNIQKAVEDLYKNPDKLHKLAKQTRKFAQDKYSESNSEVIINAYSQNYKKSNKKPER